MGKAVNPFQWLRHTLENSADTKLFILQHTLLPRAEADEDE